MSTPKNIAILGSTGSIGRQTVDIVRQYPERFKATVLVAGHRVDDLIAQSLLLRPDLAIIADEVLYDRLHEALAPHGISTASGANAIVEAMQRDDVDTVVTATVGYSGLAPTLAAIRAGKDIALANKETLVVAGELVNRMLADSSTRVIPVDSEHSAIYQCLIGEDIEAVRRLIITASGGPFRTFTAERLRSVSVRDALSHPNWSMGAKITIDSATMLNKAFEIIEAHWLFGVEPSKIQAVVHPQSIVHSMVEFRDGAVKAQLGLPDMHLPIRYALGETVRLEAKEHMTLVDYATLTFEQPDEERFPCLRFAHYALERCGNSACVINAANEVAVAAFLAEKISFLDIYRLISKAVDTIPYIATPTYDDYVQTNAETRKFVESLIK